MKEEIEIYRRRKMLKSNNIVKIYDIVEGECCEKNEWKSNNVYIIT